jgi:hypothetical protein
MVGGNDAFEQARPCLALRHQQAGFNETFRPQSLLNPFREPQIEIEFRNIARAHRAGRFGSMSNVQKDGEFRSIAFQGDGL